MKVVFVSNYINHHQIPVCNELYRLLEGAFVFVQTEPMEAERVSMGWHHTDRPSYVKCWYEEEAACRELILESDVVIFGGTDEESYIQERLSLGKLVMRYSERLYKTGQWKAISPRGLRKKYRDHTRYRKAPVYLLCAGAYVPSDFALVRAYPGKRLCWGYFPETKHYDLEHLFAGKGYARGKAGDGEGGEKGKVPYLLWAARMIDWKHPELALETARYLRENGLEFHLDLVGDGPLRQELEENCRQYGLESYVDFVGFQPPEKVRGYMEQADIFLFTSDRQEGWGAVANEAMNSGCALVADVLIGAAPYLVRNGENGLLYLDGNREALYAAAEKLVRDRRLCRTLGEKAYETITRTWNAENAAGRLVELLERLLGEGLSEEITSEAGFRARTHLTGHPCRQKAFGCGRREQGMEELLYNTEPCSIAPVLWEGRAKRLCWRPDQRGGNIFRERGIGKHR